MCLSHVFSLFLSGFLCCIGVPILQCVCVELLKRSKTCTSITLAIFWQYLNLYLGAALESGFPHVYLFVC